MKKQFIIKPAKAIKNVTIPAAKAEWATVLKFSVSSKCCDSFDVGFIGLGNSKPVFSL